MIQKIYSVYDTKVGAYLQPFFCPAKGAAIRSFSDIANEKDSQIGRHPGDYVLFELGSWDDSNASVAMHDAPVSMGVAIEFVKTP